MLGADVKVEGELITGGDLIIGGSVKGRVVANNLTIGENASLSGIVEAENAVIAGTMTGKITAKTVSLKRTANVSADITAVQLSIEPGGSFEGYSRRVDDLEKATVKSDDAKLSVAPIPALTHAEAAAA
ncbi:MAG: bactofilin family protein [Stellaceae bacterium]